MLMDNQLFYFIDGKIKKSFLLFKGLRTKEEDDKIYSAVWTSTLFEIFKLFSDSLTEDEARVFGEYLASKDFRSLHEKERQGALARYVADLKLEDKTLRKEIIRRADKFVDAVLFQTMKSKLGLVQDV